LQEERDEAFSYSFTHTVAHPFMVRDMVLAMPSRKAFLASALVTPTVPPSRAYLTLTLPVGGDAVADEGAALARRVARDPPLLVAATLSTVAFSMARAEESVVPVAAEVIALTVLT